MGGSPRARIPRKCVNHSYKLYPLVLLSQQGRHFVGNKPSEGIPAKKVRSMALLSEDQLNVMRGKLTYSTPVFTRCCWVSIAQGIKGYYILRRVKERYQYNTKQWCRVNNGLNLQKTQTRQQVLGRWEEELKDSSQLSDTSVGFTEFTLWPISTKMWPMLL